MEDNSPEEKIRKLKPGGHCLFVVDGKNLTEKQLFALVLKIQRDEDWVLACRVREGGNAVVKRFS